MIYRGVALILQSAVVFLLCRVVSAVDSGASQAPIIGLFVFLAALGAAIGAGYVAVGLAEAARNRQPVGSAAVLPPVTGRPDDSV